MKKKEIKRLIIKDIGDIASFEGIKNFDPKFAEKFIKKKRY